MELKSNKPLIIINAALSLAVITLSIQVVFLTFTIKDQKDSLRYLSSSTDVHTIQNKLNGMQNNLLDITRELETLKADNNRLSAEVATMSAIVNQSGTDNHFLQQELSSFDERINELEKKANDTAYELQSLQRSQNQ
ncbi:MAG TPA: hypothetical protein H9850_02455 [Candidatus Anaerobiospirillum pullistercoris]|uniref:Uncharacterized protein n=1 Tax=Candidatus Anaerobiospirillum pullistercoris TaxID=2838452 RepID=A0A9D1WBS1_9GAMM|nr:hypothetical protein [Candidatus Anaerobiospirillum pullistercoris]